MEQVEKQVEKITSLIARDDVRDRFQKMLGDRSDAFLSTVLQIAKKNEMMRVANHASILNAAATAAALNLPISDALGYACIVPYGDSAQFQIMKKGLVQLALRSGQYTRINVVKVWESELVSWNKYEERLELSGVEVVENETQVAGWAAYIEMKSGFRKNVFWPISKIKAHGRKYSKLFDRQAGLWEKDFDAMAEKTVLKHILSHWGVLTTEMQTAIQADQTVQEVDGRFCYVDNPESKNAAMTKAELDVKKERQGYLAHIQESTDLDELEMARGSILTHNTGEEFRKKFEELKAKAEKINENG